MEETRVISYYDHEHEMARMERMIKRLTQIIIICVALIFASNALWLYYWNQYDYEYVGAEENTYSYNQDGVGVNIIGTHNEVANGAETNDSKD